MIQEAQRQITYGNRQGNHYAGEQSKKWLSKPALDERRAPILQKNKNLAAAAKKFYVQERKESKLQKALEAAMRVIYELKAKVAALTEELAEYKSVRGQLHAAELEQENSELRSKLHIYEDVISRNNLWSYFSQHRRSEIDEQSRDN